MTAEREMTLHEWVGKLPEIHRANREFLALQARIAELVAENQRLAADRNAWRECAERLGRQVASLTHNIPTDIPLLGGGG